MPTTNVNSAGKIRCLREALASREQRWFMGDKLMDLPALLKDNIAPDKGHYFDHIQDLCDSFEQEYGTSLIGYFRASEK
jgi:hypothetical protein